MFDEFFEVIDDTHSRKKNYKNFVISSFIRVNFRLDPFNSNTVLNRRY
jgi:hypothetical protein